MNVHERAIGYVLEALCAACVVAVVLAAAQGSMWWAFTFAACAWGCFEAGEDL